MNPPPYWQDAIIYLSDKDKIIAQLITTYQNESIINHHNPFYTLVRAIIGQQISVKAADSIWRRLELNIPIFSPKKILEIDKNQFKEWGLSRQKINYITNIANGFKDGPLTPNLWLHMSDKEVSKQLISIKGIGQWTAEMFLIFHLHRSDIFPITDLALINVINYLYSKKSSLSKADIIDLSQQWRPYRTVATWYLWRSLDPVPVQY
ncbi:MAG: DNA-3-methyladenine glycosylase 2 family protein [cyanobacterium endosymbiont of Rhopalodia gibba]|jgi:DNA-3-methyladenine glycosylase II